MSLLSRLPSGCQYEVYDYLYGINGPHVKTHSSRQHSSRRLHNELLSWHYIRIICNRYLNCIDSLRISNTWIFSHVCSLNFQKRPEDAPLNSWKSDILLIYNVDKLLLDQREDEELKNHIDIILCNSTMWSMCDLEIEDYIEVVKSCIYILRYLSRYDSIKINKIEEYINTEERILENSRSEPVGRSPSVFEDSE